MVAGVGYMGAKSGMGVSEKICALMPPHDTYIEAFGGTGAVLTKKDPAQRSIYIERAELPAPIAESSSTFDVIRGCALEFLAALAADPARLAQLGRVLIYADPPYVLATRTSSKRYLHDFTDADHVELAGVLHQLAAAGCAVMVSGYPSQLYDQLFAGWETREFQAMTRGGVRTEKLWLSFAPGAVHWATYAGRNFTDRQRIKRKAARWAAKFAALAPAERQAVLAALLCPRSDIDGTD